MSHRPHLLPKVRSEALLGAIRGMPCTLRIAGLVPGGRCWGAETTVPCHLGNLGKGMSTKVSDLTVAAGCFACHDLIDKRDGRWEQLMRCHEAEVMRRALTGLAETQAMLVVDGFITVRGATIV